MSNEQQTLEDRLLRLAATDASDLPEFPDDKSDLPSDFEYNPEDYEEEEEVIEEITEAELLKYLDQQEDALTISQRLFYHELNTTEYQHKSSTWDLQCLTAEDVEALYGKGWVELEGLIDLDILKGAYEEAKNLHENNVLIPASRVKENSDDPFRDVTARDDAIVWLDPQNNLDNHVSTTPPPYLQKVLEFLQGPFHHDISSMIRLNGRTEFQLAYYHPNGAHYERHRDALPTDDPEDTDQRRVTAVLYLNPGWTSGDGGELKIYGRLDKHGMPVGADRLVKPQLGKILLFLSGVIDHEVMASKKPRYALTSWMR
ncbi:hypothetical protein G6F57_008982 [Rhizopus arrhizus]|uniref:Fe2OG dioxygenase domain-containing protein n=1 Tax=Rhizopus oryzae TaxID=64495 RepID=A0A9P6XHE5_RHIOR|nr:hypothetical protein G6F23_004062 [Rhizopus arrhizus]KAG0759474.1 hypothetical protein G6F24_009040 [Rhizopus arrhizus]KAG0785580.1 hypothetical protein G6F21_009162 [Rhizopus arrhizus]KAG0808389.1 hypothetical protein G6F20_009618 [Rhizopus arrhizus]KAG0825617.1 hypothetical protein G6F19_009730 [Rhizopus arrhizus]